MKYVPFYNDTKESASYRSHVSGIQWCLPQNQISFCPVCNDGCVVMPSIIMDRRSKDGYLGS